jgi:L-asparaginase
MSRLLLLATGDTIAQQPRLARVATGAELLARVSAADVEVEDVLAEPSWDTSPATMLAIARRVRTALREDGFDGVVVTHGVDTMAETAFLTELVAGKGAIVFTGAVRYLDDPSPDGPSNLSDALAAARVVRGTAICLGGELHAPRWATFTGDGFSSRSLLTAGIPDLPAAPGEPESNVALIKTYPGMPDALLRTAVDLGARGIVLEGTGSGNVPVELFTTIAELSEWDIPVVVASRTHWTGDPGLAAAVGAIGARGLPPDQARVALMVALAAGGVTEARRWFTHL